MPVHVLNEANRCLQCKKPLCRLKGCPIQTNIPEVVRLFKENRDHALHLNERGTLEIDERGETTMEGVFASGDVVTGAKTVVAAVAVSKQIADNMDAYMQEKYGKNNE